MDIFDFVFLDLETTGIDAKTDKIIEIAAIIRKKTGEREVFHTLIKPVVPVPSFITRLTGIDDAMLEEAPSFEEIRLSLREVLQEKVIVAHNAAFDIAFLENALGERIGQAIDTLELCRLIYPQMNSYELRNLARELSLDPEVSHRALSDALLLEKLFDNLIKTARRFPLYVLEETASILSSSEHILAILVKEILRDKVRNYDFTSESATAAATAEEQGIPKRDLKWDISTVEKMFLPGGCVARGLEVYQKREEQVRMSKAIGKAFQQRRHLLIEAGTGIGKSLAYLIPAVLWAIAQDEKVVIATHTIALQEQLLQSEIAFLKRNLDVDFNAAVLKGRNNYLCLYKWKHAKENCGTFTWKEQVLMARLSLWLNMYKTGDRDTINLREWETDLYQQLSSQSESCLGQDCPFYHKCFYHQARKKALAADIIIANHSLLLSDLKLGENILPNYQYLVVDEAHHLEDEGTKQFSEVFSLREYGKKVARLMSRRDLVMKTGLLFYWKRYFAGIREKNERLALEMLECIGRAEAIIKKINDTSEEIKEYFITSELPDTVRIVTATVSEKWWQALKLIFDNLLLETADLLDCLKDLLAGINMEADTDEGSSPHRVLRTVCSQLRADYEMTGNFFAAEQQQEKVYWLEKDAKRADLRFHITPLKTGSIFHELLFTTKTSIVMTSATLCVEDSFSYLIEQLGIPGESIDTMQFPSPFFYDEQTLLLIDSSLPNPALTGEEGYNLSVAEALLKYVMVTKGNTLILFTSHKQLRFVFEQLCEPLRQAGLELYADGINGRRHTLIKEMKSNPRAVVLGANTFWEGIDLPGEALKSLVIVRLPFTPPSLPLVEARLEEIEKEGKSGFLNYSLPQAVLRFRQGYGRLIRTINDSGIIITLDNRLVMKKYGEIFIRSLPTQKYFAGNTCSLVERIEEWFLKT